MPNNLCIIPARGGSKRIPRKNIKPFFKKPIIAYAIETALNSGLFDEVMVSTEDEEIAKIGLPNKTIFFGYSDHSVLDAVIFDGRNQYNTFNLEEKGIEYYQIGKQ